MTNRGWEVSGAVPDGSSVFFGDYRQAIAAEFLATVEFLLESGPFSYGVELWPSGPRRVVELRACVGGELGLRHLPTERLLCLLNVRCEADISRDLADIAEAEGTALPMITDAQSAAQAPQMLVELVDAHALVFAREHASVEAMLAFIADGGQSNRTVEFEYMFVPALLAASGRHDEARAALIDFGQRTKSYPDEDAEYRRFGDDLSSWLDAPTSLS